MLVASGGVNPCTENSALDTRVPFVHGFAGDYRAWKQRARFLGCRCITLQAGGSPTAEVPEDPAACGQRQAAEDMLRILRDHGVGVGGPMTCLLEPPAAQAASRLSTGGPRLLALARGETGTAGPGLVSGVIDRLARAAANPQTRLCEERAEHWRSALDQWLEQPRSPIRDGSRGETRLRGLATQHGLAPLAGAQLVDPGCRSRGRSRATGNRPRLKWAACAMTCRQPAAAYRAMAGDGAPSPTPCPSEAP